METEDVDTPPADAPPVPPVGTPPTPPADTPPAPPVRRSPGMRPALLVVGIAAGLVLLFGILAVVSSQGTGHTPVSSKPAHVRGTSLRSVPAYKTLTPILRPGTPPDNIVDALTVPQGVVVRGHQDNNRSVTQYDKQVELSVHASEGAVVRFYKVELKAKGWSVFDVGSVSNRPGAIEVLAQKGGTDGWYWEVGAVVSPTTFDRAGTTGAAGTTGGGTESTSFTLRLFQEPDDD